MKGLALLLASSCFGAVIDPSSQPNYPPQVQPPYTLSIPPATLGVQFPQNDFLGSNGLICSFSPLNPAQHDVCTVPGDSGFTFLPPPVHPVPTPFPQPYPSPVPEVSSVRFVLAGLGILILARRAMR